MSTRAETIEILACEAMAKLLLERAIELAKEGRNPEAWQALGMASAERRKADEARARELAARVAP